MARLIKPILALFQIRKIVFFIFLFQLISEAQVIIPFAFWRPPGPLTVSPSGTRYVVAGDSISFTAMGGTGNYSWSITAGATADGATINPTGSPNDYTARLTSYLSDTVTLNSGAATITIPTITYDSLSLAPTEVTLAINTTQAFTVSNGYCFGVPGPCSSSTATWSIVSGGGSITSTGVFTAPPVSDDTIVQVADSIGNIAQAAVTTVGTLSISPKVISIPVYSTINFSALLGTTPYNYTLVSGSGTVGCNTTLTSALSTNTTSIPVVSTANCPVRGSIFIGNERICYTAITATSFLGNVYGGTTVVRGCNGTTASTHVNGAKVNADRTVYIAPSTTGSATVQVTDNFGETSDATITIIKPVDITMGIAFACALYSNGRVKCWGENTYGQLGIGSTSFIGDSGNEMGGANGFVNVGTGRTVTKIRAGAQHVCALLDNSTVKCWGYNLYGQLGQGNTTNIGATSATEIANLNPINFNGKIPNNIWAFAYQSCAKFTDNTSVCWGLNTSGQSGQGTTTNITTPPTNYFNFGSSRHAVKFGGLNNSTCAILNDGAIQCWGDNADGQLGYGDTTQRRSPPLVDVNLGAGRTAVDIDAGSTGTGTTAGGAVCAALDDGTVVCWGRDNNGQGGVASDGTADRKSPVPTDPIGFNAVQVAAFREGMCAKSAEGYLKCWGRNNRAQLFIGNTTNQVSAAFCKTTLNGAHSNSVTTIAVASTAGCPGANGKILVGSEVICYTGMTGSSFTGATRGCAGTTAAAQTTGATVTGILNFGNAVNVAKVISGGGRSGCILTGNGTINNDRIKCWGTSTDTAARGFSGLFLFHTTLPSNTTNNYLGDSTDELGDELLFLNH